ncbi:MAG: o-succinylbenzoate synthase [Anaerolineales bacterium]
MKIEQITLRHIQMPYRSPFQTSRWTENDHDCVIVEAHADGLTGWGECVATAVPNYSYESTKTNWHVLEDFLVPTVLETDLANIEAYRVAVDFISGHNMAKAGLEMALWDLFAQRAGVSLQTLLGGDGDRVRVGVSVGIQSSPEKLLEVVNGYLADGYRRIKLKIKPGRDVSEVSLIRQHHPDLLLQADGNSVYRLSDAERLKELDGYNLLLLEQPLAMDDIIDHAKLQPQLQTPVCLDESIHSAGHARWALELGACRIINIKPGRVGGMHEAIRIHDYCHARNVPVWMGGMLETGIGRAANVAVASLSGFTLPGDISASMRYYFEDIIEQPFELNADSTLSVPQGVGLGVKVSGTALRKVTRREEVYRK